MIFGSDFETALWSRAESGGPSVSLKDLATQTLSKDRSDQLTCWTLVADVEDASQHLAMAAKSVLLGTGMVGATSVFAIDDDEPFVVSLWPSAEKQVFHLVGSVPVTDGRWRKAERWVQRIAPKLSPVYLDQSDFEDVCASLSEHGDIAVSRLTARVIADGSSYTRGWKAGGRREQPSYHSVLSEVDGVASVRTLSMSVGDQLSLHLRRMAGATYYSGEFPLFHDLVLRRLSAAAASRVRLFGARERQPRARLSEAISLRFTAGYFADADRLQSLVEALRAQPGMGVAVVHRNPYLQVAVTDYRDGSNCNLFVTDDDAITVYPGFRASMGSLARLSEALAETFSGVLTELVEARQRPNREQLTTDA